MHGWQVDFQRDIAKNDRFIPLIVDNCTAHPKYGADDLPHIRLVFLPPNVTSVIQPCEYGDHQDGFVDIDSSLECHGVRTDDEICALVVCQDTDP